MKLDLLTAISPIDGRYRGKTDVLAAYFSEFALIKYLSLIHISNPFWSNWFFSIGGGAEATFGDNDKAGSFGNVKISCTFASLLKRKCTGV